MRFLITLLLFQFSLCTASGQIDSLKRLPLESLIDWLAIERRTSNKLFPEMSYFALNQVLQNNNYGDAGYLHSGLAHWNYLNYEVNGADTIIYHRIKQIEYDEKNKDWKNVAGGYVSLSEDYRTNHQMNESQKASLKALEIYNSLNDEVGVAKVHYGFTKTYTDLSDYQKAITYADMCLPIFEEDEDYFRVVDLHQSVYNHCYRKLGDYDTAEKHLDMSIKLLFDYDIQQKIDFLADAYHYKGELYLEKKEYRTAESFYQKAWQLNTKHRSQEVADKNRFSIGNVLYLQEEYTEALPHLKAGVKAAKKFGFFNPSYFVRISECYEKLGQYKQALNFKNQAIELEENIWEDEMESLKSESLVKYDSGRKDQQLLEQNRIIEQKNWIQYLSIGVAGLLAILLSTLFYFFTKNSKTNSLLKSKNKLIEERNQQNELLLKEIHHRVKNNLETVSALLTLQGHKIDDANAKSAMRASQNRVKAMGLLHQKLYQGKNLDSIEMKEYFVNLTEGILDSFDKDDQVNIELAMNQVELDIDTAVPIGLIVNELLTNALKYAFPPEYDAHIKIKLQEIDQGALLLEVSDNGVGIDLNKAPEGTGFGSQLVELLTKQLRGEMDKTVDNGTIISLLLKKTKAA